jgi:hypothetical protein
MSPNKIPMNIVGINEIIKIVHIDQIDDYANAVGILIMSGANYDL